MEKLARILREIPGMAEIDESQLFNLLEPFFSEEERKDVEAFREAFERQEPVTSLEMPDCLVEKLIPRLVTDMHPETGRVSLGNILQALSFRLNKDYADIYKSFGIASQEEVDKLKKMFEAVPEENDIREGWDPLKKIQKFLALKDDVLKGIIQASVIHLFLSPSMVGYGCFEDENYDEEDESLREAQKLADRIMKFPG